MTTGKRRLIVVAAILSVGIGVGSMRVAASPSRTLAPLGAASDGFQTPSNSPAAAGVEGAAVEAAGGSPPAGSRSSPVTRLDASATDTDTWALNAARLLADPAALPEGLRPQPGDAPWEPTALTARLRERWPSLGESTRQAILGLGFSAGTGEPLLGPISPHYPSITCTYSTTHFDIHFDSTTLGWGGSCASVPTYVTDTAAYFETAWTTEVDTLSWTAPPSDGGSVAPGCSASGGGPKYDVFATQPSAITDPINSSGAWAYTQTACRAQEGTGSAWDNENSPSRTETLAYSSYIQLAGNPTSLGSVTIDSYLDQIASHEFNHALQFGYTINGGSWAQESTAEWMMTQVNPSTANFFFNQSLFGFPDLALTTTAGPGIPPGAAMREYGSWPFMQYLGERLGGQKRVRELWERMATSSTLGAALDTTLAGQGTTLDAFYHDFAVALRVMSPNVANGKYALSQSAAWPSGFRDLNVEGAIPFAGTPAVPYDSRVTGNGNQRLQPRGTDYIAITDTSGLPFKVCVSQIESTATMSVSLVQQKTGSDVAKVVDLTGGPPCAQIDDAPAWNNFTLAISYASAGVPANLNYYIQVVLAQYAGPANEWYFAEGYTGSGFQEYLDIQNPGEASATVTIDYQLNGGATVQKSFALDPKKRQTVNVNDPVLGVGPGKEVSARVSSDQPVVAERPMYFNYAGVYNGGHIAVGARSPNTTWYFAEGYTAPGFDEYLTLQNPNPVTATATIEYQREDGAMPPYLKTLPPNSRTTIVVYDSAANGGATRGHEVSAKVTATSPIVAERPMYFNYAGIDDGGHDVVGANAPSTTWSFAEGYTGTGFDEYITIQNPNATAATVTTTYQFGGGAPPKATVHSVPAFSRRTVAVHGSGEAGRGVDVSTKVTSTQPIVAERPMYFGYNLAATGAPVNGGHNVMGTVGTSNAFYFASGETPTTTDEYLTIQNPNASAASASILYMFADGFVASKRLALPANSRTTTAVHGDVGRGKQVAVAVYSDAQVVVERPTYFQKAFGFGTVTGGGVVIGASS